MTGRHMTPTPEIRDKYLNMELMLPRGGTLAKGRVTERKRDHEGNFIGRSNANPILDTREYEVNFEDGENIMMMTIKTRLQTPHLNN